MLCWFKSLITRIPLPFVPTMLGICTLSAFYEGMGYPLIRWIAVICGCVTAVLYVSKIAFFFKGAIKQEYSNPMLAALYPTIAMLIEVLCAFFAPFAWWPCAIIFFTAFALQWVHIVASAIRFFIKRFSWETFLPSWYVTTHGVMISTVAGMMFMPDWLAQFVVIWGIVLYVAMTPPIIHRMRCCEVKADMYHSQAIILGPCSLCAVSLVNVYADPNLIVLGLLYACVLASLVWVFSHLPKFFSFGFKPGYAGMTFPMVVALMATQKVTGLLSAAGLDTWAFWATQLAGVQLVVTTVVIGVVASYFLHYFIAGVKKDAEDIRRSCTIQPTVEEATCCDMENQG